MARVGTTTNRNGRQSSTTRIEQARRYLFANLVDARRPIRDHPWHTITVARWPASATPPLTSWLPQWQTSLPAPSGQFCIEERDTRSDQGCLASLARNDASTDTFTKERKHFSMMANRLDRDEESLVRVLNLRVRLLDETLVSEFHMGQQAAACANGPDISVLPYLSSNMPNSLQSGRRPHKRLLT